MPRPFNLILCDFTDHSADALIDQQVLNAYTCGLMAIANQGMLSEETTRQAIYQQFEKYAVSNNIISKRHALPVFDLLNALPQPSEITDLPSIYQNIHQDPHGDDIGKRSKYFEKVVIDFLDRCYSNTTEIPDEIVYVTSMAALIPSPLQRYLSARQWGHTIVTNAFFYGCHASIPALRIAMGSLLNAQHQLTQKHARLDIVHTEFLSLHMNALDSSANNIIGSTLFSDGLIKYSLCVEDQQNPTLTSGLKIIYVQEKLIPNTSDEMLWEPSAHQLNLYLSKKIPAYLSRHIVQFVEEFFSTLQMEFSSEKNNLVYAIHPGGSQILDVVAHNLRLDENQMQLSRNLLYEQGNISSATLPSLWKQIIANDDIQKSTRVLCLTFGPGLTIAAGLLEKI